MKKLTLVVLVVTGLFSMASCGEQISEEEASIRSKMQKHLNAGFDEATARRLAEYEKAQKQARFDNAMGRLKQSINK